MASLVHGRCSPRLAAGLILSLLVISCSCSKKEEDYTTAPPPTDEQVSLEETLRNLPWGNIAFNSPESMKLREKSTIELVLSLDKTIEELSAQVDAEGAIEGAKVKVSNRMLATLTGFNFDIKPIESEEQAIPATGTVTWRWDVIPTTVGEQDLHLVLTALVEVDGKDSRVSIRTFDRTIHVRITPVQRATMFVQANWQWLWAAVLIPIGGLILQRVRKNRASNERPER